MMFPYSGGPIFGGSIVGKHRQTPYVSQEKMDLSQSRYWLSNNNNLENDIIFTFLGNQEAKEEDEEESHGKSLK